MQSAISKRHGDVMPSGCHSERIQRNPSIASMC